VYVGETGPAGTEGTQGLVTVIVTAGAALAKTVVVATTGPKGATVTKTVAVVAAGQVTSLAKSWFKLQRSRQNTGADKNVQRWNDLLGQRICRCPAEEANDGRQAMDRCETTHCGRRRAG
jgi:hypothetical protein